MLLNYSLRNKQVEHLKQSQILLQIVIKLTYGQNRSNGNSSIHENCTKKGNRFYWQDSNLADLGNNTSFITYFKSLLKKLFFEKQMLHCFNHYSKTALMNVGQTRAFSIIKYCITVTIIQFHLYHKKRFLRPFILCKDPTITQRKSLGVRVGDRTLWKRSRV